MTPAQSHPIFQYKMTPAEVDAYSIALLWEKVTSEVFPDERGVVRLSSGDPRRCSLFKYCWKAARELRGLLKPEEQDLFIRANLLMVKQRNLHLSPSCLAGKNAWVRWSIWKRAYDRRQLEVRSGSSIAPPSAVETRSIAELDLAKRFLFKQCKGEPLFPQYVGLQERGHFRMWVGARIPALYAYMSPWMRRIAGNESPGSAWGFDQSLQERKVSAEVKKAFCQNFRHEFSQSDAQ